VIKLHRYATTATQNHRNAAPLRNHRYAKPPQRCTATQNCTATQPRSNVADTNDLTQSLASAQAVFF